jgi:hypothetical protein
MEPTGSLLSSQELATSSYTKPNESHPISFRHILKVSFHLYLGHPSGLIPSGIPGLLLLTLINFYMFLANKYLMVNCSLISKLPMAVSASNAVFSTQFLVFLCKL